MANDGSRIRLWSLAVAIAAGLSLVVGGFAFASTTFGSGSAVGLSLLLILPLAAGVRLCCQWPAVRGRDLGVVALLFCVVSGGGMLVVRDWYRDGIDLYHAEDLRWAEFERRFRQDRAFADVQVHKTERKEIHWASGSVASQTDLDRLITLAAECGIKDRRLDGPYVHSVSLRVRGE